ncbi:glycerate kinase [Oryzobacter telluris]|uniref:glycerate kinase n=1 Tax=Oryzobacter telluris TaxID=3149179 RepID=UPI00370D0029
MLVASDAFKGSLGSLAVGEAVRLGVLDVAPDAVVEVVGVADGGEGTVAAALSVGWRAVAVPVHGPTGERVTATPAVREAADETAGGGGPVVLVELADACGLGRLPGGVPAPLTASSRGLGEAIRAALDLGPSLLVVGVGGSASTDGGAGMLAALGARVLDAAGVEVADGGAALTAVATLDLSGLDPRVATTPIVLAADVDSPLLGPTGAATVFGPQKGATPDDVTTLESALTHWADLVGPDAAALPGAGAAGGVGFALLAVLGAERRSGSDTVLDLVGLDDRLAGADLVVTGEGSLDAQTLAGKAVAGVARRAAGAGVPVVAVCGRCALTPDDLATLGVGHAYALADLEPDEARSIAAAADLLRRVGRDLARRWLSP